VRIRSRRHQPSYLKIIHLLSPYPH
jgi:hypothetical protein